MIGAADKADFIIDRQCLSVANLPAPIQLLSYQSAAYQVALFDQFTIAKPDNLINWAPQRQAQFLAGRLAAKQALCFGQPPSFAPDQIAIGSHREPVWPTHIIGSISHSQVTSIAAVRRCNKQASGLGIDLQSMIDPSLQSQIATTILTKTDRQLVNNGVAGLSTSALFTLIFSAKESFFKACFNTVGHYFDFDAVSVTSIDKHSQQLVLTTQQDLAPSLAKHFSVTVTFALLATEMPQIMTICSWER